MDGDPGKALANFHEICQKEAIRAKKNQVDPILWKEMVKKKFPGGLIGDDDDLLLDKHLLVVQDEKDEKDEKDDRKYPVSESFDLEKIPSFTDEEIDKALEDPEPDRKREPFTKGVIDWNVNDSSVPPPPHTSARGVRGQTSIGCLCLIL
jgi:hypothetical protein